MPRTKSLRLFGRNQQYLRRPRASGGAGPSAEGGGVSKIRASLNDICRTLWLILADQLLFWAAKVYLRCGERRSAEICMYGGALWRSRGGEG